MIEDMKTLQPVLLIELSLSLEAEKNNSKPKHQREIHKKWIKKSRKQEEKKTK